MSQNVRTPHFNRPHHDNLLKPFQNQQRLSKAHESLGNVWYTSTAVRTIPQDNLPDYTLHASLWGSPAQMSLRNC